MSERSSKKERNRDTTSALRIEVRRLRADQKSLEALVASIATRQADRPPLSNSQSSKPILALQDDVINAIAKASYQLNMQRPFLAGIWKLIKSKLNPAAQSLQDIRESVFFDGAWYLRTYPDVAAAGMDPAKHYFQYGAIEGRDPGPYFSTRAYLVTHPELARAKQNALLHYLHPKRRAVSKSAPIGLTEGISENDKSAIMRHMKDFCSHPLISVVMPVYNTPEQFLRQAVASVQAQLYPNWELCIANDASPDENVARILNELAAADSRIKVVHRKTNGNISAASNSALVLAKGEFIALMDHDDLLDETALYEVAAEINGYPDVDIIYSDEDQIDARGVRSGGYFKSDFNPELLLGQNMVSHLGVYRKSLIDKLGGFRVGLEGSQDYDLILRAWSVTDATRIRHIPEILYHWRRGAAKASFSELQAERCIRSARVAIQQFLDLEGEGAKVVEAPVIRNFSRIVRRVPSPAPLVSIIVPTKDRAKVLDVCISGILYKTDYPNLELIIIDHESKEAETKHLFEKLKKDPRVRIIRYTGEFNYSAMNNLAVEVSAGKLIALVNNDIEIISSHWLKELVSHAVRPEVGAVGAKLKYRDGRIQHAGIVIGLGGFAGHAFYLSPTSNPGYFGQAMLTRGVSAVTAACLVVRKSVYQEVGGLDAKNLPVAFNDVDFCLKVQAKGYRNVWTPFAELIHHESLSRGAEDTPAKKARFNREADYMSAKWSRVVTHDPFYNPNLSLTTQNYEPAIPSRRRKPWAGFL